jgi:hypothetical protein
VGVVATLLKQVPAAAKFKSKLEVMETELLQLRADNARLEEDLAQYINQWETLDGPQVNALQYLATHQQGHATEIATAIAVNIQIAETSLVYLLTCGYVKAVASVQSPKSAKGKKAQFCVTPKAARYLRERGLHK